MINFKIEAICKINEAKMCELLLENGRRLAYVPVPYDVRYGIRPIERFLKTDEGQEVIERFIEREDERWREMIEKYDL